MRVNLILILLSLTLLAVCTFSVFHTAQTMQDLIALAQQAADVLQTDAQAAQEALSALEALWRRKEHRWQVFVIHEDLDAVTLALVRTRNALQTGDIQATAAAFDELMIALDTLHHKEIPSLGNIF